LLTDVLHRDRLLQDLLSFLLLSLRLNASLLIRQLAQPFIRELHSTQLFEHSCCRFIRPGTPDQGGEFAQFSGHILPFDFCQTSIRWPIALPTLFTAHSLERYLHSSEARQYHTRFGAFSPSLPTSALWALFLLLFTLAKCLFERFFHSFSSGFSDLAFQLTERGGCIHLDFE
jgi:hypothetical protein